MSTMRHRFHVVVDGQGYDITTSARDLATAEVEEYAEREGGTWTTFRLVHAAMLRLDLPVPADLDAFVDLLDEVDSQDGQPDLAAEPDPTHAVA